MIKKVCTAIYNLTNKMLVRFSETCFKYSKITLTLSVIFTLVCAVNLKKLKMVFSVDDLAGEGLVVADELGDIRSNFEDGETSLLILRPEIGSEFSSKELCSIRKWYSRTRVQLPELNTSFSSFDYKQVSKDEVKKVIHIKNILPLDCDKNIALSSYSDAQKKLNETPFAIVTNHSNKQNLIFSFTFAPSTTSKFGAFDPDLIHQLRKSVDNDLKKNTEHIQSFWVGPADYQWYVLEGIKFSKYVNLGMLLFLFIGLKIFFGSFKASFLYVLSLVIAAIWLFGTKGMFHSNFDILCTSIVLILGISSLEDFVFVCYDQLSGSHYLDSVRKLIIPSFYTSITTILGFLSLLTADVEAVRRMGVWSAYGALIEWYIVFIFFPCLLLQFKSVTSWVDATKSKIPKIFYFSTHKTLSKKTVLILLLAIPFSFIFFNKMNFNVSPIDIFPDKQEYSQGIKNLRNSKKWIGNVYLIYDSHVGEEDKKVLNKKFENVSIYQKLVVKNESKANVMSWLKDKNDLDQIESEAFYNSSNINLYSSNVNGQERQIFYVNDTSSERIDELKKTIDKICEGKCHLGGEIVAYSEFAKLVPQTLMKGLMTSLLLVGLVLSVIAVAQNKGKYLFTCLISSYWGAFFTIFILEVFNSQVDFWKAIFASILVGLAGDNTIQFLFASENKTIDDGISERGVPSIITSVFMALTSLIYLFSYYSSPRTFGVILSLGILSILFGDLWLFKSFNRFLKK